jgi:choline kinase
MSNSISIVINAAGVGSRLGLNIPKSLVSILGRQLIDWQFSIIPSDIEVIVVVGFKGRELADAVKKLRPNASIVINHNYHQTNTAGSFKLGARFGGSRLLSLNGDLLTTEATLKKFIHSDSNLLGLSQVNSVTPVYSEVSKDKVINFSYEVESSFEWTGLANLSRDLCADIGERHMFQGIQKFLPMNFVEINCMEIDEISDLQRMEKWIKENL